MPNTPIIPIKFEFDDKDFQKLATQMEKLYQDAKRFSDAIKQGTADNDTSSKLKKTTQYMGEIANLQNKHAIEAQKTSGIIGTLERKVKQLKAAQKQATNTADVKKYNTALKKTQQELTKAKETTRGWGKALGSFQFKFNALGNIAANVASSITNGITQSIRGAIQTTVEFEKTFAAVLTLLDKSQKKEFGDVLKKTSIDLMQQYGFSIEDVNKAMFDAVSAGVKMGDMFTFMQSASKLAIGGVTDLNSSVKGLASIVNAFHLTGSDVSDVASALFQAQKFGITYVDEMVNSLGRLNTIANMTGASYREMMATFAAITKVGLNTEESVTGLRNVFKELVAPSKETQKELEKLGIGYGTTALKTQTFIGVMDKLQIAYEENNDILANVFGNIRGLTGATGILGDNYKRWKDILIEVIDVQKSKQALDDAVNEQMGTMAVQIDRVKGNWNAWILSMTNGEGVAGSVFRNLIAFANELLGAMAAMNPEMAMLKNQMESGSDSAEIIAKGIIETKTALIKKEDERIAAINKALKIEIEAEKKRRNALQKTVDAYNDKVAKEKQQVEELSKKHGENYVYEENEEAKLENNRKKRLIAYSNAFISTLSQRVIDNKTALTKIKKDEKIKHSEWIKLQKEKLKIEYELNKSFIELQEDSNQKSLNLAKLERDYKKKVADLMITDAQNLADSKTTIDNEYYAKARDLAKKAADESIARADKVAKAWAEAFDLPEEDYIPDIPFDTAKIAKFATEHPLLASLGLDQESLDALKDATGLAVDQIQRLTDAIADAAKARVDAIQKEIDASNQRVDELQRDRDHEWERLQDGYANNYNLKQQELEDEKKRRETLRNEERKALIAEKKANDARIVMSTALTVANLVLAGAELFEKEVRGKGIIGVVIALAGIAAMTAGIFGLKANAQSAAKFADGVIDLNGDGTERSDSIPARLSKGESVMTADTTKNNRHTLTQMQDNPKHPLFRMIESNGVDNVFNRLADSMQTNWVTLNAPDNKWDELLYKEIKTHNKEMKSRPYSYTKGNKIYTIEGNIITITEKK